MTRIDELKVVRNIKKNRLKISCINDLKDALEKEGYRESALEDDNLKEYIVITYNADEAVINRLFSEIQKVTYKSNNVKELIDYIEKLMIFEDEHNKLCEEITKIKRLNVDRVEYDRVATIQDRVDHIIKVIDEIRDKIFLDITKEEEGILEFLEKEIEESYLYTKDIEILKKMIVANNHNVKEEYDEETATKSLFIEVPKNISSKYIKAERGSVEYYKHLTNNIPRVGRLIKNINKYIEPYEGEEGYYKINQSSALQDSINIAMATYNGKEFKAISGGNNIEGYCVAPSLYGAAFKSCKVNKLGKLGTGYNRINDSEKKILEEIHKQIQEGKLEDKGELILCTKWEPCPSCYFVMYQFCNKYPNIKIKVKFNKKYGER